MIIRVTVPFNGQRKCSVCITIYEGLDWKEGSGLLFLFSVKIKSMLFLIIDIVTVLSVKSGSGVVFCLKSN